MPGGAERFLGEVFRDLPEGAQILIWSLAHKRSSWYSDPAKAAHRAEVDGAVDDVYVGCAWREANLGAKVRGAETDCAGITGLWADVDVEMPGHARAAFKTKAAAKAWLEGLPLPPTIIVDSGNGLQAWWLFSEAWGFEGEADRAAAARMLQWWQAALRGWARQSGADLDATHDLPRVLRIPATTNRKSDPPKDEIGRAHV